LGLRNPEHERFAALVGAGGAPKDAWQEVYGRKPVGREAAVLAGEPDVVRRIREVQDRAVDLVLTETVCSRAWLLDKLRQSIEEALKKHQHATAIRGIELAGRLPELRLFPNETRIRHTKDRYAQMTDAEILAEAERLGLRKPQEKVVNAVCVTVEDADGNPLN